MYTALWASRCRWGRECNLEKLFEFAQTTFKFKLTETIFENQAKGNTPDTKITQWT